MVMVVALWLVLFMCVVDRGRVDGRLGAVLCAGLIGRAVGGTGEQRHEADRDDRTDLSGPPAQLGQTAEPRVPRGVPGMTGPGRVTGVGIEVCPALAPGGRHACGIRRLARNRVSGLARNGISLLARNRVSGLARNGISLVARNRVGRLARDRVSGLARNGISLVARNGISLLARNRVGRLVGNGGMALVGVDGRPIGRTALHGAAARLIAAGVVRVSVLCWLVSRAEPGSAGEFRWPRGVLAQAAAGPPRRRALRARPGIGRRVGAVLTLAGACPIRAASLPWPVVC